MAKTKNLNIEEHAKIVVLVQKGYSTSWSIQVLCVGDNEKAEDTGTVANRMRSDHPKATTAWQDHELVRLCLRDRRLR